MPSRRGPVAPTPPRDLDASDVVLAHEEACDTTEPGDYADWIRHHQSDLLRLTRPQHDFLHLDHQTGLFWAGIRTGKSTILATDCALYLEGRHPRQRHRPPTIQLHAGRSWGQMVETVRTLWRFLPPRLFQARLDLSTGHVRGQRYPVLTSISGPGAGSQVRLCTYEQGPLSIQGWTIHRGQLDEPPPQVYYAEARSRLLTTGGALRLGFCPASQHVHEDGRGLDWLWGLVDSGDVGLVHAPLTVESCTPISGLIRVPHTTQAQIDAFARETPRRDRAMRLGLTRYPACEGVYFDAWSDALIQTLAVPAGWWLGVGIDHGSKPGAQRATLLAVRPPSGDQPARAHALRHYRAAGLTTDIEDATAIRAMIRSTGHDLEDIDCWVGDRAHDGGRYGGIKSNWRLIRAFAQLLGISVDGRGWQQDPRIPRPLRYLTTPIKYDSSVWDGTEIMHRMMVRSDLTVDPSCEPLADDIRTWAGGRTEPAKDGIDSARYILVPMVAPTWRPVR